MNIGRNTGNLAGYFFEASQSVLKLNEFCFLRQNPRLNLPQKAINGRNSIFLLPVYASKWHKLVNASNFAMVKTG